MKTYRQNKAAAVFRNTDPSMTDQSQLDDTNINIIMKKYRITGVAPGAHKQPSYGDFTELPETLAELMQQARELPDLISSLPENMQSMPLDQLLALSTEDLQTMLAPPDNPSDAPQGEQK